MKHIICALLLIVAVASCAALVRPEDRWRYAETQQAIEATESELERLVREGHTEEAKVLAAELASLRADAGDMEYDGTEEALIEAARRSPWPGLTALIVAGAAIWRTYRGRSRSQPEIDDARREVQRLRERVAMIEAAIEEMRRQTPTVRVDPQPQVGVVSGA